MSLKANLQAFLDDAAADYNGLKTILFGSVTGTLADLTTTNKTSIVAAINEVKSAATGAPPAATESTPGVVTLATLAEMATGVGDDVATVAGVRQERNAVKAEILGGVGPAFDTLQELLTEVQGTDADLASLVTTVGQKANSADVYSKAEIDAMLGSDIGNFDASAYYAQAKA